MDDINREMNLSDQAVGALMMALQKSLMEQSDIVPVLKGFRLRLSEMGLLVMNPPMIKTAQTEEDSVPNIVKLNAYAPTPKKEEIARFEVSEEERQAEADEWRQKFKEEMQLIKRKKEIQTELQNMQKDELN